MDQDKTSEELTYKLSIMENSMVKFRSMLMRKIVGKSQKKTAFNNEELKNENEISKGSDNKGIIKALAITSYTTETISLPSIQLSPFS